MADKASKELSSSMPTLTPLGEYAGKPPLTIKKEVVVVGTDERSHLHLVSSTVSKHHALIVKGDGGVYIQDLASRTRVKVNGKDVSGAVLKNGDKIQIGRFHFQFRNPAQNGSPREAAPAAVTIDNELLPGGIEGRALLIGRAEGCEIILKGQAVSSRHAVIFEANGRRFIRDLDSRTGTFVNGQKTHQAPLRFGDKVRIGDSTIILTTLTKAAELQKPATTEPSPFEQEPIVEPFAVEEPLPLEDVHDPAAALASLEMEQPGGPNALEEFGHDALSSLTAPEDLVSEVNVSAPVAPEPSRQAAREALAKAAKTAEAVQPARLQMAAREKPIGLEPIDANEVPALPVKTLSSSWTPSPGAGVAPRETPIGLEPIEPHELTVPPPLAPQAPVPIAPPQPAPPRVLRPAVPPPLGGQAVEPSIPLEEEPADLGLDFLADVPAQKTSPVVTGPKHFDRSTAQPVEPVAEANISATLPADALLVPEMAADIDLPPLDLEPLGDVHPEPLPDDKLPTSAPAAANVPEPDNTAYVEPAPPTYSVIPHGEPALPVVQFESSYQVIWTTGQPPSESVAELSTVEPEAKEAIAEDWVPPVQAVPEPIAEATPGELEPEISQAQTLPVSPPPAAEFELPPATPAIESPVFDLGFQLESESASVLLPDLDVYFGAINAASAEPASQEIQTPVPEHETPEPSVEPQVDAITLPQITPGEITPDAEVSPVEQAPLELTPVDWHSAEAPPVVSSPLHGATTSFVSSSIESPPEEGQPVHDLTPAIEPSAMDDHALAAEEGYTFEAEPAATEARVEEPIAMAPEPQAEAAPAEPAASMAYEFEPAQDLVPLEPEGIATINSGAVALPSEDQAPAPFEIAPPRTDATSTVESMETPAKRRRGRPKKDQAPAKPTRGDAKRLPPGIMPGAEEPAVLTETGAADVVAPVTVAGSLAAVTVAAGATLAGVVAEVVSSASAASPASETAHPIEIDQSALTANLGSVAAPEPIFQEPILRGEPHETPVHTDELAIDLTMPESPGPIRRSEPHGEADAGVFKSPPVKGPAALQVREEDFERLHRLSKSAAAMSSPTPAEPATEPAKIDEHPLEFAQVLDVDSISVEPIADSSEPFGDSKVDLDAFLREMEKPAEPVPDFQVTSPSDSAFGRELESFTKDSTGPLVEGAELNATTNTDIRPPELAVPDLEIPNLVPDLELPALDLPDVETPGIAPAPSIGSVGAEKAHGGVSSKTENRQTPGPAALSPPPISQRTTQAGPFNSAVPLAGPTGENTSLSASAFDLASAGFAFDVNSTIDHVHPPHQAFATGDTSATAAEPAPAISRANTQPPRTGTPAAPVGPLPPPEKGPSPSAAPGAPSSAAGTMMNAAAGLAHIGGGIVNLDHFLGGMPVKLPNLTPPAHLGKIAFDLSAPPTPAPIFKSTSAPAVQAPSGRSPLAEAPPAALAPQARPKPSPPPQPAPSAPAPTAPAPSAPAPVRIKGASAPVQPPVAASPVSPAPPAKPKTPPRPRNLRQGPFATTPFGVKGGRAHPSSEAGDAFGGITTAFEGLSAIRQTDVFSNLDANLETLGNAVFGTGSAGKPPGAVAPAGPGADLPRDPDKDFADDDFWNRTDEEDGLPPMGVPKATTVEPPPVENEPAAEAPMEAATLEPQPIESAPAEPESIHSSPDEQQLTEVASLEEAFAEPAAEMLAPVEETAPIDASPPEGEDANFSIDHAVEALAAESLSAEPSPEEAPPLEKLLHDEPLHPALGDIAHEEITYEEIAHEDIAHDDLPPLEEIPAQEELPAHEEPPAEIPVEEHLPPDEPPLEDHFADLLAEPPHPSESFDSAVSRDEISALEPAFGHGEVPIRASGLETKTARIRAETTGQTSAAISSARKRRGKHRTRLLMLAMLASMGVALAGIWSLVPVRSNISGNVTFVNYDYTPESSDGIQFESAQRKMFSDPQMRLRAVGILRVQHPEMDDGFLDVPDLYTRAINSLTLSSSHTADRPETTITLTYDSNRVSQDKAAMSALMQALIAADAGTVDNNRRLRAGADAASHAVSDARQKLDQINAQIAELESRVANQPSIDTLTALTTRNAELEAQRRAAEDAADSDRQELLRLQSPGAAGQGNAAAAETMNAGTDSGAAPVENDPQLQQMKQQLADLTANLAAARSDEAAGATLARQQLEGAVKDFNDQLSDADNVLGSSVELKQFVDSAKDSQFKARSLITMLIVDGEDLEKQLEDTRQDVADLIQSRQREKWASDPEIQQLQASLDSAQHKYNAAVGQGIEDANILSPLQNEINDWTAQIKSRENQLGVDSTEVKVEDGLNSVIAANRSKLDKEKQQIDEVLDPLEKQLNDLDPVVAALPDAQQELARHIRERLNALNDARKHYADAVGEGGTAPSAKVTSLQQQLAELKTQFDRRQSDLAQLLRKRQDAQRQQDLVTTEQKLDQDQKNLDAVRKAYFDVQLKLEGVSAQRDAAKADQMRLLVLSDQKSEAAKAVEDAQRDFDEKQAASASAFDIKPFSSNDVTTERSGDPRWNYSAFALIGLAVVFAMATMLSNARAYEIPMPTPNALPQEDVDPINPRNRPKDPISGNGFQPDSTEEAKWA